ncbi:putative inactive receptor kinase At4g23740 [Wolffia australiana]
MTGLRGLNLGIILGGCVLAFLTFAGILLAIRRKKNKKATQKNHNVSIKVSSSKKKKKTEKANPRKPNAIVFFDGCNFAFDLEDLLGASAELLGKGSVGTSYKAVLEDSAMAVVVKRLKNVGAGKREFQNQMAAIGALKHENIVPLRAYFFSKEEKLIVYDYLHHGSASSLLHERGGQSLSWESRLRVAIGAARGIAHLHAKNIIHGNLKSSNIFLDQDENWCVSEIGLGLLASTGVRRSKSSDVYSFGVFLLELLTGKCDLRRGLDLVRWVQSVVKEEWTGEVFDVELMRWPEIEEGLVEMLQVAMACVAALPEHRPPIATVVELIEDIDRRVDRCSSPE